MITQLVNRGFKDQRRRTEFSGMDLFTSNDVNGVGKSSVLEAVKLALLGEIPGRARTLDDLLQFTSGARMSVEIQIATRLREVTVERRFLRAAERGEKRPIVIDQSIRRYEEGDRWIRDTLGAVSMGFDPYEFLNLTDQKKRQWIISHSPESQGLNREVLHAILFARMVKNQFGDGLVQEQVLLLEMAGLEDLFGNAPPGTSFRLLCNLSEVVRRQDGAWVQRIGPMLDKLFSLWNDFSSAGEEGDDPVPSKSGSENIALMLAHLKAEIVRLKNIVRERATVISCLGETHAVSGKIEGCRETIHLLIKSIEDLGMRIEKRRQLMEEQRRRQERRKFLQDSIASLTRKPGENLAISEKLQELAGRLIDTRALQEELDQLNMDLREHSENHRRQEMDFCAIAGDLTAKRKKIKSLRFQWKEDPMPERIEVTGDYPGFHCPLAVEIQCRTDMRPHYDLLSREIKVAEQRETAARTTLEKTQKDLYVRGERVRDLQDRVKRQARVNEMLRQEMQALQERLMAEETSRARTQGMLKAYHEEMESLSGGPVVVECAEIHVLDSKKRELILLKEQEEAKLESLLYEQGREDAVAEVQREKARAESELKEMQTLADLLGGIQGEMAARIANALEREVNEALKLIDVNFDFTIDLSGTRFLMGWNRDGKVIPFKTINSAHFILFIVPFLAVLLKRMGHIRERAGLPTLKVLCIEAESMTQKNLVTLLKGLSVMKAKGYLDNVLVAHYTSVRDPRKLFGFKEHIFMERGEEGL